MAPEFAWAPRGLCVVFPSLYPLFFVLILVFLIIFWGFMSVFVVIIWRGWEICVFVLFFFLKERIFPVSKIKPKILKLEKKNSFF